MGMADTPRPPKYWQGKLHDIGHDLPKVVKIDKKWEKQWGVQGTCAIPHPEEVDALMKKVPKGKVTTINEIRAALAKKHKATIACPITTGIFATIAACAATEQLKEGKKRVTPYWRTLKGDGEVNPKYPGGVAVISGLLKKEGLKTEKKGKSKVVVVDFEKKLAKLK
ncbi:MAG: hypothetical protein ABIG66_00635 [Candidatus Kerfeldbacteria bacterium]